MLGQQTFRLVPTTLANPVGDRPPMTSKAAKAAYRKASKGPKISRAEQRRLDAEEIERQKKEYEKERNAAKAKAAREKKLKKERDEKEERKKRGLPEPSRFVRASQPTIKGFVKMSAGAKRTWEDMESPNEEATVVGILEGLPKKIRALDAADEEEEDFGDFPTLSQEEDVLPNELIPVSKVDKSPVIQKTFDQIDKDHGEFPVLSPELEEMTSIKNAIVKTGKSPAAERIAVEQRAEDDDFGDFLSLSQVSQLMDGEAQDKETGAAIVGPPMQAEPPNPVDEDDCFGDFPALSQGDFGILDMTCCDEKVNKVGDSNMVTVNKLGQRDLFVSKSLLNSPHMQPWVDTAHARQLVDGEELDALVESQLLSEAFGSAGLQISEPVQQQHVVSSSTTRGLSKPPVPNLAEAPLQREPKVSTKTIEINWARPILPNSSGSATPTAITVNNISSKSPLRDISTNMLPPPLRSAKNLMNKHERQIGTAAKRFSVPPPSTMAFLEANMDDFFPSPSQQVRELLDDVDDMPSNTQIAREINSEPGIVAVTSKPQPIPIFSANPELKKLPASKTQSGKKKLIEYQNQPAASVTERQSRKQEPPFIPQSVPEPKSAEDDLDLQLFSSQDFEISSQDLREIDTSSKAAAPVMRRPTSSHEDLGLVCLTSPKQKSSKSKPRFFEEKEEDLFHAALHESLAMSRRDSKRPSPKLSKSIVDGKRVLKRTDSVQSDYGDIDIDLDENGDLVLLEQDRYRCDTANPDGSQNHDASVWV